MKVGDVVFVKDICDWDDHLPTGEIPSAWMSAWSSAIVRSLPFVVVREPAWGEFMPIGGKAKRVEVVFIKEYTESGMWSDRDISLFAPKNINGFWVRVQNINTSGCDPLMVPRRTSVKDKAKGRAVK